MDSSHSTFHKTDSELLLTPSEAAEFLGLRTSTLACWRSNGQRKNTRLAWRRLGGRVRYRLDDLRQFVDQSKEGGEAA